MAYPHNDKASIFVQIPSYRDKECIPTIEDIFYKAQSPERITVGVCWQYDPEAGETPLELKKYGEQVRILNVPSDQSKGVAWARHQAQLLWRDEDYILQIDSHTRLVGHWDDNILRELRHCPSEKAVLSCPPHGYIAPDLIRKDNRPTFRRPKGFSSSGLLQLSSDFFDAPLSIPTKAAFVVPRFIFSSSKLIKEVPVDPHLYVEEEDITLSARMWTHGWDIYSPGSILLYHLYNNDGKQRPLHWKDFKDWIELQNSSRQRYRYIMGIDTPKAHERIEEFDKYKLGDSRPLSEYTAFCGIDFVHNNVVANASHCPFIESIRKHKAVENYWLSINTKTPKPSKAQDNLPPVKPQPIKKEAKPLVVDDFTPFFNLPDDSSKIREIQLYGGHNVALFFLPTAEANFLRSFFDEMEKRKQQFAELDISPLFIFPTSSNELASVKKWLDLPYSLWADEKGEVGKIFGVYPQLTEAFTPTCFLLSPNLRIVNKYTLDDITPRINQLLRECETRLPVKKPAQVNAHAPVLVVPNVLSKEQCKKLIAYWTEQEKFQGRVGADKNSAYKKSAKRRIDAMVKGELQEEIDERLSGTLFPEIEKVFGLDITRREEYKIGCYDSADGGFFNQHRDNFELPLSHRRYAMTLNLNDDFEGGGLNFPEYGSDAYKAGAGTAVIFPCSLMHRAAEVTKGQRFMLVSFFYGEEEAMKRYQLLKNDYPSMSPDDRLIHAARKDLPSKTPGSRAGIFIPSKPAIADGVPSFIPQLNKPFDIMTEGVPPGILVIKNFLDEEACQAIKDYSDKTMGRKLEVVDNERSTKGKTVTKASDSRITEYVKIDGISDKILPLFVHIHSQYLEPFYNVDFEWFERPQILRYTAGGKYGQHADSEHLDKQTKQWVRAQDRDYSTLTYLNDDYGGGEILFNEFDFKIKPTTGMLVAFPSDHRYLHTALPTTSGVRYVIVSWSATLGTPRVKERAPFAATFLKLRK